MTHALDADSFQSLDSRTAADFCEVLELSSSELADMVSLDNTNSMRRCVAHFPLCPILASRMVHGSDLQRKID